MDNVKRIVVVVKWVLGEFDVSQQLAFWGRKTNAPVAERLRTWKKTPAKYSLHGWQKASVVDTICTGKVGLVHSFVTSSVPPVIRHPNLYCTRGEKRGYLIGNWLYSDWRQDWTQSIFSSKVNHQNVPYVMRDPYGRDFKSPQYRASFHRTRYDYWTYGPSVGQYPNSVLRIMHICSQVMLTQWNSELERLVNKIRRT